MRSAGALLAAAIIAFAATGARAAGCRVATFEGSGLTVCDYRAGRDELRLVWRDQRGPLGSLDILKGWLGRDAARVAFAMNAGMYTPEQAPLGLYIEQGRLLRPLNKSRGGRGNFALRPNGVFWVDAAGAPHVDETIAFERRGYHPRWATQSGPLLLKAGAIHPAIAANGPSQFVRNAVGVRGNDAVFVVSDAPVSFGRLARFLRDGLGRPDGLYLDGSVSSLWAPALRRMDQRTGLGPMVVVLNRAS